MVEQLIDECSFIAFLRNICIVWIFKRGIALMRKETVLDFAGQWSVAMQHQTIRHNRYLNLFMAVVTDWWLYLIIKNIYSTIFTAYILIGLGMKWVVLHLFSSLSTALCFNLVSFRSWRWTQDGHSCGCKQGFLMVHPTKCWVKNWAKPISAYHWFWSVCEIRKCIWVECNTVLKNKNFYRVKRCSLLRMHLLYQAWELLNTAWVGFSKF